MSIATVADKTLAMKLLEGKKIDYEPIYFPATMKDAVTIAHHLGLAPAELFKTLVVTRSRGKPLLVMIPADSRLDLKRLARAVAEKKVAMASQAEAEALTGLQVGGISALALINRGFAIYLDAAAQTFSHICVSAGERGADVRLAVDDLVKLTGARIVQATE